MKKKISSFVTAMFVLLICVFASACGNKYKNLEFRVYYAFSVDATEWIDGTDGISLNYDENGEGDSSLVFGEDGLAHVYLKVEIKNVKNKHLDNILVSVTNQSGLDFVSGEIKNGGIIDMPVVGNANTTLKFYENNSGKRHEVSFEVSKALTGITANHDLTPTMIMGGNLNLLALNNLTYEPYKQTNQIGVTYSVESMGKFDNAGVYSEKVLKEQADDYLSIINGKLEIADPDFVLNGNNYAVKIKATSIFHTGEEDPEDEISTSFYVYLIESGIGSPVLKYVNKLDATFENVLIYENGNDYSKSLVKVSLSETATESVYLGGVYLENGKSVKLQPVISVCKPNSLNDYEEYDFLSSSYQAGIHGLIIKDKSEDKDWKYEFSIANRDVFKNNVKVSFDVDGLDFSASSNKLQSVGFDVEKHVLPSYITINDVLDVRDGQTTGGTVYSTTNDKYLGVQLKLSATPNEDSNREIILEYDKDTIKISQYQNGRWTTINDYESEETTITSGQTIAIRFTNSTNALSKDEQTITIKTVNTPAKHDGQDVVSDFLKVTYTLDKLVTANAFEFVDEEDKVNDGKFILDAETDGYIYVRVYHTGQLDAETITLKSNNSQVLFNNNLTEISLANCTCFKSSGTYTVYRAPIKAISAKLTSIITIKAGDGTINDVESTAEIESVYTATEEQMALVGVVAYSDEITSFNNADDIANIKAINGAYNFAIPYGKGAEFVIADNADGTNIERAIYGLSRDANLKYTNSVNTFENTLVNIMIHANNEGFRAVGTRANKTQIAKLVISYYNKDLELATRDVFVQIAVYDEINQININFENGKNTIGFVNSYYNEISSTTFKFNAYSTTGTPQSTIVFAPTYEENLEISSDNINKIENVVTYEVENNIPSTLNDCFEEIEIQNGNQVRVALKSSVENQNIEAVDVKIIAKRFGVVERTEVAKVNIATVQKAERITYSSAQFDEQKELAFSFMDVADGGYDQKTMSVELEFASSANSNTIRFDNIAQALTHMIYTVDIDEFGNKFYTKVSDNYFQVIYNNGNIEIKAFKGRAGGRFILVLAAKDSYCGPSGEMSFIEANKTKEQFTQKVEIAISVSDGTAGAAYKIYDVNDLKKINNNLSGHFVLANSIEISEDDFTPIGLVGQTLNAFEGNFNGEYISSHDGKAHTYTITMKVSSVVDSTVNGTLAGLFGVIGTNGKIQNLNLVVDYANNFKGETGNGLKIGAVAGVNNGRIENVVVNLSAKQEILINAVGTFDFGGIVSVNNGQIVASEVKANETIHINSTSNITHNIGFVAGTNNGTITGEYLGKESLTNFTFDVLVNLNVINSNTQSDTTYYVGAIAGKNTGDVKNMLVGGWLSINEGLDYSQQVGAVGGLVGNHNEGLIDTSIAMSLNILSNADGVDVAGIAGVSSANIYYVKFISAQTDFGSYVGYGKVEGKNLVAGVAAKANAGIISYASVESFIQKVGNSDFATVHGGTTTAGLVAENSATLEKSFVSANIYGKTKLFLVAPTGTDTYFIGKVWGVTDDKVYKTATFSVIDGTTSGNYALVEENVWSNTENYNGQVSEANISYLLFTDGEPLMIIAPKSISASVSNNYVTKVDSVYVPEFNYDKITVKETVLVNYFAGAGDEANTHNIPSENDDGLLDIDLLPENSQGGLRYEIVGDGYRYAYINDRNQIVFTGVSGKTPILVRIYSVFNPEIEVFVVFYTHNLFTSLEISSSSVYENELNIYTGEGNKVVALTTKNTFDGKDYASLFNVYGMSSFLTVEATTNQPDSQLNIAGQIYNGTDALTGLDFNGIAVRIKDNSEFPVDYTEKITFNLYLVNYYAENTKIKLDSVDLLVRLYSIATGVDINGEDVEISTIDDTSFEVVLTSDYIDRNNSNVNIRANVNKGGRVELKNDSEESDFAMLRFDIISGDEELTNLLIRSQETHFASLFNYAVGRTHYEAQDGSILGYRYQINLELEDSHYYRYIENNIKFNLVAYANSSEEVFDSIEIVLKPTELSTARIENYAVTSLNVATDYSSIVANNNTETSIVTPGSLGNIMMIYLEPTYSNVEKAFIKTSSVYVPLLRKDVQMKFTQLVWDERVNGGSFVTLYAGHGYTQQDDTLELELLSEIDDNGEKHYTGIICVYIQLEKFGGLETTITATLEVETNDGKQVTRKRNLLTTYLPDTAMSFYQDQKIGDDQYLIQQDTDGNQINIQISGYQFNSNPRITFEWAIPNGNYIKDYVSYYLERDFENITENDDGSYTVPLILNVGDNIPAPIKVTAEMSLITKEGQLETAKSSIVLYPVDYLLTSVEVSDVYVPVNQASLMNINFDTKNKVKNFTNEILDRMERDLGENPGKYFSYYNGENLTFADENPGFKFSYDKETNTFTVIGLETFETSFDLSLDYAYKDEDKDGVYELKFGVSEKNLKAENVKLKVSVNDSKEEILVYSAEDIYDSITGQWDLEEGGYYVLMQDIVLENVVPITTNIAQFDGNNRRIYIKSFMVDDTKSNYGLFAKIGKFTVKNEATNQDEEIQTILRNVIVDYSMFDVDKSIALVNNATKSIVFGGLVAENAGGLIYNCDVINTGLNAITLSVLVPTDSSVIFGGLVGRNNGIITNSRVGRDRLVHIEPTGSTSYILGQGINFEIYYQKQEVNNNNRFESLVGGFVGINTGTISTSYVTNTGINNYSTCETQNGDNNTAGFVARNTGTISYSYVEADDTNVTTSNPYTDGYVIKNSGNGVVSGFVYSNTGNVNNSYANTVLETKSAFISGFVYNNSGTISESYAACTMNANTSDVSESVASYAEQPFVGVDESTTLLSNGTLENTYYLMRSATDNPYTQGDKDVASALNESNFQLSEYLVGFSFVLTNSQAERQQGVWSYYSVDNMKRILPELINADMVAHSYRYVLDESADVKVLTTVSNYAEGTVNNPHTIGSVEDFNRVFTSQQDTEFKGYVRLINDIDFKNDNTAIKTMTNFTLGANTAEKTSFDGNGLSINGIYLEVQHIASKVGLFAEIKNAYVKNLKLGFANPQTDGEYSTKTAQYLGGLAGKIEDSVILNIDLDGASTTLSGKNFVGGLAGHISGKSLIYGITTNLSVQASWNEDNLYYSNNDFEALHLQLSTGLDYETYLTKVSFAGGVAGVFDLDSKYGIEYNLQFIDVLGNEMANKLSENVANISAKYAGGVAGFAGEKTNAYKLRYFTGDSDRIFGDIASGGIYAISMGSLLASQVTSEEDTQFDYDTNIGEYIKKLQEDDASAVLEVSNVEKLGNLDLIGSYRYAGGLVGVALNSTIRASYAKVGIKSGTDVGGIAGVSVSSIINYSYAIPYVNLYEELKNAGGLIGSSYGVSVNKIDRNDEIKEFEAVVKQRAALKNTDIQFTYSTLILQNNELKDLDLTKTTLDYICANYREDGGTTSYIESNASPNLVYVYAGTVKYPQIIEENKDPIDIVKNQTEITSKSSIMQLFKLYSAGEAAQALAFREVFSSWDVMKYWSLKEEKYFPLLKNERVKNVIEIDHYDDFDLIRSNLDADFMIINDIEVPRLEQNWIIPRTFTGTITGHIEGDSRRPIIKINSLQPNQDGTTGFFERTAEDVQISNLEIEWGINSGDNGAFDLSLGKNITMVSGLICDSDDTLIQNVHVTGSLDGSGENVGEGYVLKTTQTVGGFAGFVGNSMNTRLLACTFSGKVEANIGGREAGENVYVAGLMGQGETRNIPQEEMEEDEVSHASYISGSNIGVTQRNANEYFNDREYPVTSFNLTVSDNNADIYVGGLTGYTEGVGISSCRVGGVDIEDNDYKEISITLNLGGLNRYFYCGGISGLNSDGLLTSSEAVTNITLGGELAENSNTEQKIGGLVGYYAMSSQDDLTGIYNCNTKSIITVDENEDNKFLTYTNQNVLISNGVAEMSATSVMKQCLFTGEINTELSSISKLYSGAAVARVGGGGSMAIIEEVATNAILTVGCDGTIELYAGGLVGQATNMNLSYSNSWARVIPLTSVNATVVKVGGLIGCVKENVYALNCYTTTSIVADSVAPRSIKALTMGGLVGKIEDASNVEFNSVYYSSDYALFAEENKDKNDNPLGINLNAQALVYSSVWHTDLRTHSDGVLNNIWKTFRINYNDRMPYLASLESALNKYGVLDRPEGSTKYDYLEGSPMKPKQIIANNEITFDSDNYIYYLLTVINEAQRTTPKFSGNLNGILIGEELTWDKPFVVGTLSAGSEATGIIGEVSKHSAISNLHVRVDVITTGGEVGVIAGTNNGVIFNSSVQGSNIKAPQAQHLGLITYNNNGLVAYCYSTAEIVESSVVGGIVYQNSGKMLSNYFTGYIESEGSSAGMFVTKNGGAEQIYVYNNYVGGVINSKQRIVLHTNFAGISNEQLKEIGSRNYIDDYSDPIFMYANTVITNEEDYGGKTQTVDVLTSISTANLMGANRSVLDGNWYYTVEKDNNTINVNSDTFGMNYNYPIYQFNKIDSVENLRVDDLKHSLRTGTGQKVNSTLETRYEALIGGKETYQGSESYIAHDEYTNAFKIPHLGVLSSINGLGDRNYVLIYDIDGAIGNTTNVNWRSAKVDSIAASQYFNGFRITNFNGVFISNKYLTYQKATPDDNKSCLVTNLTGNGLLGIVENAYIGDITLGNFTNLTESGALAVAINGHTAAAMEESTPISQSTTINNIYFAEDTVVTSGAITNNYYGALFGEIGENANLEINNLSTSVTTNKNCVTLSGTDSSTAGLIAGKNKGYITLSDKTEDDFSNYYIAFDGNKFAGGFVGELSAGTLNANGHEIHIITGNSENSASVVGGLAARTTGDGSKITSAHVFMHASSNEVYYDAFGGMFGYVEGVTTLGDAQALDITLSVIGEPDLNFVIRSDESKNYFGSIAGWVSSELTVNSFAFEEQIMESFNVKYEGENELTDTSTGCGVGLLVGAVTGILNITCTNIDSSKIQEINAENISNVGMVVGYFSGDDAQLNLEFEFEAAETKISGTYNVGGIVGWAASGIKNIKFQQGENAKSLFTSDVAFATIVVKEGKNFGGLIGKWNGDNEMTDGDSNQKIYIEMKNINPIILEGVEVEVSDTATTAENIGGVVGKLEAIGTVSSLTNAEAINYSETAKNVLMSEDGIVGIVNSVYSGQKAMRPSNAVNVGGVIGSLANSSENAEITVKNLYNTSDVYGYQNVGGLIGFIADEGVTLTNCGIQILQDGKETSDINLSYDNDDKTIKAAGAELIISQGEDNEGDGNSNSVEASNVVGTINVGGAVGAANQSTIEKVYASKIVQGNANVGGLVGYASGAELKNNIVQGVEKADSTGFKNSVIAIYYAYMSLEKVTNPSQTAKPIYSGFIPTNVGGFIGRADNTTNAEYNIIKDVIIGSVEEGKLIEYLEGQEGQNDDDSKVLSVISTISNNMFVTGLANNIYEYTQLKDDTIVDFEDIKSGFGSMYGFVDHYSISNISSNVLVNPQIVAQLGINVGTYYGVYKTEGDDIAVPTLYGEVSINGSYQVGGVVGMVDYNSGENFPNIAVGTGSAEIVVQDKFSGFYIGGLIGKTISDTVKDLALYNSDSVKIKINVENNYSVGGLIGLAQKSESSGDMYISGSVGKWEEFGDSGWQMTDESDHILTNMAHKNSAEFGGLIGLLKQTQKKADGVTVTVEGHHMYPFTVNTIQNVNYVDEQTNLYTYEDNGSVDLIAEAGYTNLDTFIISGSSNTDLYDNEGDRNPLNEWAKGWSKQYTGFKRIQRLIPKENNNGAGWDSLVTIYDASQITHVATLGNMYYSQVYRNGQVDGDGLKNVINSLWWSDKVYTTDKDGKSILNSNIVNEDYICYTIYDRGDNKPLLYSPVGIASPYYEDEFKYGKPVDIDDGWKWDWTVVFTYEEPPKIYYLNLNDDNGGDIKSQALSYMFLDKDTKYETRESKQLTADQIYQNENVKFNKKGELVAGSQKIVTYEVPGYLDVLVDDINRAFFVFDVIYDNKTLSNLNYSGGQLGYYSDDMLPVTGSIFDVTGTWTKTAEAYQKNAGSGDDLEKTMGTVMIIVEVVAFIASLIFTGGFGAGIKLGFQFAIQGVKQGLFKAFRRQFFKTVVSGAMYGVKVYLKRNGAKKLITSLVSVGVSVAFNIAAMTVFTTHSVAEEQAFSYFVMAKDHSTFGYLGSTYNKKILYENDGNGGLKLVQLSDTVALDPEGNSSAYHYYSATRPQDYYLNYYVGMELIYNASNGYLSEIIVTKESDECFLNYNNGIQTTENREYKDYSQKEFVEVRNIDQIDENGNYQGIAKIGKDKQGKYYRLWTKYIYYEDGYYVCTEAGDVYYYNVNVSSKSGDEPLWVNNNSSVYTYGKYNPVNRIYEFINHDDNNLTYDNNKREWKLNGYTISAGNVKPVLEGASRPVLNYVVRDADPEYLLGKEEGYEYFTGAYYSPRRSNMTALTKYASLTFKTSQPAGNNEHDYFAVWHHSSLDKVTSANRTQCNGKYIKVNGSYVQINSETELTTGAQLYEIGYMQVTGIITSETGEFASEGTAFDETLSDGSTGYYTKLYPQSVTDNPCAVFTGSWQDLPNGKCLGFSSGEIQQNVTGRPTYYLYEGGYVVDNTDDAYYGKESQAAYVFLAEKTTANFNGETLTVTNYGDFKIKESEQETFKDSSMINGYVIIDGNNNFYSTEMKISVKNPNTEEETGITYFNLMDAYDEYKSYILVNEDGIKVEDKYFVKNNKLYEFDITLVVKNGQLQGSLLTLPENEGISMYANMVLTDFKYQFYTRYNYGINSLELFSFAGGKYSLAPDPINGSVNNNVATSFVESVRVRLSRGDGSIPKIKIT